MTNEQWNDLVNIVNGQTPKRLPVGFIIDSPWLPGWSEMSIMDYFASESCWFEANLKAMQRFPHIMFLPGFWSEYGMCTEPSAFGAKCVWHEKDLPFAGTTIQYDDNLGALPKPNVKTDGLLPLMLKRLVLARPRIEAAGHAIRFAVARGPLNIASFLMGTTEFMMGIKEKPEESHKMLSTITEFLVDWLQLQASTISSIDGIFVLDDLVGFLGNDDFSEFAKPYLTRVFNAFPSKVRFFHNDAHGLICAPHLPEIGVNLFNYSFNHSIEEMKKLTQNRVTLLGNIPPRDVMAQGTPEQVRQSIKNALASTSDRSRIILSCGGGMAPETPTANIEAFLEAASLT